MFKKLSIALLASVFAAGLFLVPADAAKEGKAGKEKSARSGKAEKGKKAESPEIKKLSDQLMKVKEKERELHIESKTLEAKLMKARLSDGLAKIDADIEAAKTKDDSDKASKLAEKKEAMTKAVSLSDEALTLLSKIKTAVSKKEKEAVKELQTSLREKQKEIRELMKKWRGERKEKPEEK